MRYLLVSAFLLPLAAQSFTPAGSAQIMDLHSTPSYPGGPGRAPTWTGGVLVSVENNGSSTPIIHIFDDTGQETLPIAFAIPGAQIVHIAGVARANDGEFAVAGWTTGQDNLRPSFLSLVSPDHRTIQTARPAPYMPTLVTFAPDGTIWTVGQELSPSGYERDPVVNRSHGVLRHFDRSLVQIGSFIPRTGLATHALSGGYVVANKNRVGWYAWISQDYYEVTFDGKVSHFAGVAPATNRISVRGFALTDGDEVFATNAQPNKPEEFCRLNRASGAWVPVAPPAGTILVWPNGKKIGPEFYGGDGDLLVFRGYDADQFELKFFAVDKP